MQTQRLSDPKPAGMRGLRDLRDEEDKEALSGPVVSYPLWEEAPTLPRCHNRQPACYLTPRGLRVNQPAVDLIGAGRVRLRVSRTLRQVAIERDEDGPFAFGLTRRSGRRSGTVLGSRMLADWLRERGFPPDGRVRLRRDESGTALVGAWQ